MDETFSHTKLFTILISIFFTFGLLGAFYNNEIIFTVISFIILAGLILLINFGFKKSIILFLIFIAGLIRAKNSMLLPITLDEIQSNNAKIEGQIISSKDIKNNKTKFYFKINNANIDNQKYENLNTKILVYLKNNNNNFSIGDYATINGKLRIPNFATNPHQFDYKKYLLNNDTKNILYADDFKKTAEPNLKHDFWFWTLKQFEIKREKILEKHSKNIKSPRLEILGGIVFGNETINPDEKIKENFKNSGLLHLLAASGLNVALIFGIWWWIANLIRFPYILSILTGGGFVILYTFMTGFPPSILRASIMLLFILLGKIIDRNAHSLALIFFVAFLMLFASPKMLFDIGFQLSFVVTIGLVICIPIITSKFEKINKKFKEKYKNTTLLKKYFISIFSPISLITIIAIPLVAQIFVIPLQLHYFNNFTPLSLLANIAVVPFIGILSFVGFISSIFSLIPILNEPVVRIFDSIANPLLGLLIKISEFFASFKYSSITISAFNLFQIFSFWSIVLIFFLNLKNNFKHKKEILVLIFCIILFSGSFINLNYFKSNLEIMMFDVGHADCFLIKTPENKFIMIDTGKKNNLGFSDAQIIINKYLLNEKIKNIEALIITHFDIDHVGGAVEISKFIKPKQIIVQKNDNSQIKKEILNYYKNPKYAKNNEIIYQENDLILKTFVYDSKNKNESSIITLLNYKNKNILFMGDSGIIAYNNIKKYLPDKIDILKVGHHGSKNSINDEMIKAIKPDYALISVGYNKFNHPNHKTIETLNKNKVKIFSTNNYGFVKIIFEKNKQTNYYFNYTKKRLEKLN